MRRRPPFALVLVAVVIPVLIALALTSRSSPPNSAAPRIGDTRPASACAIAHARAGATARSVVKAHATVSVPVRVTEQVHTPTAVVTASRGVTVVESASVQRPVSVRAAEKATARACAHGARRRPRVASRCSTRTRRRWPLPASTPRRPRSVNSPRLSLASLPARSPTPSGSRGRKRSPTRGSSALRWRRRRQPPPRPPNSRL